MPARRVMDLLSLPYDVRHLIYNHLFPPGIQIDIQAYDSTLRAYTPEDKIPIDFLLTCRAINIEATEYLYNHYLFNILGLQGDCLKTYPSFVETVRKYAREKVHVDAFGNGPHTKTACISVHTGGDKLTVIKNRDRGVSKSIKEIEREVALTDAPGMWTLPALRHHGLMSVYIVPTVLVAVVCIVVAILI